MELNDKAEEIGGKKAFGAIGFGGLKISVHRECVSRLFNSNDGFSTLKKSIESRKRCYK